MILQIVKFQSPLSIEEVQKIAAERASEFEAVPGLIQKYYFRSQEQGQYGGLYIWDSVESLTAYRNSELAASIPQAYKLRGAPEVEIYEIAFSLRD